jgi:hypothetical protein
MSMALSPQQLQRLPLDGASSLDHRCIVLPFFTNDGTSWLPLVWIDLSKVSIQVVIAGDSRRFGFRWESPESGTSGLGEHDYWHVQPIVSVRTTGGIRTLNLQHSHICEHFPTIPIDAGDPAQMLDAMLVSIYGPRYTFDWIDDARLREQWHSCSASRGWAQLRTNVSGKAPVGGPASRERKRKKK